MNKLVCVAVGLFIMANFSAITSAQEQPELGNWELGIKYIADDDSNPFLINEDGERVIEFYVHNTQMFEIEVSFVMKYRSMEKVMALNLRKYRQEKMKLLL